jgi:hypothetical protein
MPGIDTVEALAKALLVNPAWLAFGVGDMKLPTKLRKTEAAQSEAEREGTCAIQEPAPAEPQR